MVVGWVARKRQPGFNGREPPDLAALTRPARDHPERSRNATISRSRSPFRILFPGIGALIVNLSPCVLIGFALVVLRTVYKMWQSGGDAEEVDDTNHWSVSPVKKSAPVNPWIESHRWKKQPEGSFLLPPPCPSS